MSTSLRLALCAALIPLGSLALGCRPHGSSAEEASPPGLSDSKPQLELASTAGVERILGEGIDNLFRLGPRLYSGSQPEGEKGFASLKRLGVSTLVSVDGSQPDVEMARRFGLKYVHLPVGYDGINRPQAVRIVKAVELSSGPVFVHCHHGLHRGPAAAAICGIATNGWNLEQAQAWLKEAGTDPKYAGLYATVRRFETPTNEELAKVTQAELPERSEVPGLVEQMIAIDMTWDHLLAIQKARFQAPSNHPDLVPSHEALMLAEGFNEAARQSEAAEKGREFLASLTAAGRDASSLSDTLRSLEQSHSPEAEEHVERAFARVKQDCAACHAVHRDNLP